MECRRRAALKKSNDSTTSEMKSLDFSIAARCLTSFITSPSHPSTGSRGGNISSSVADREIELAEWQVQGKYLFIVLCNTENIAYSYHHDNNFLLHEKLSRYVN